ncbi:MAG: ABC transporter ATP-binding protein [Clostridia bacterium]|nr:ABC transporter ATP-binding protein [Clostridia bacterium]
MSKTIITVDHASVRFNLNAKKKLSLKEYAKGIFNRDLYFNEFFALKDITFNVKAGESWGFVGVNGSGKSTLLKLITGILRPYEGAVCVKGSIAPLLELGAGFDPQLTGRENIIMNGLILGMTKKFILSQFDSIVEFSELEKFLDVPLKNYSSGMKSRLGFAIATCVKPDILIADEVLATGDRAFQAKCEERMRSLLSGGTTLLYVSHSPNAIRKMCDHVMWLDHGQIKMMGEANAVCDAYESNQKTAN